MGVRCEIPVPIRYSQQCIEHVFPVYFDPYHLPHQLKLYQDASMNLPVVNSKSHTFSLAFPRIIMCRFFDAFFVQGR